MYYLDISNLVFTVIRALLGFTAIELFTHKNISFKSMGEKAVLLISATVLHYQIFSCTEVMVTRIILLILFFLCFIRLFYLYSGDVSVAIPAYAMINVATYPIVYMSMVVIKVFTAVDEGIVIERITHVIYSIQYISIILLLRQKRFSPYRHHMGRLFITFRYVFYAYLATEFVSMSAITMYKNDVETNFETAMHLWFPATVVFLLVFSIYLVRYLVSLTTHLNNQVKMQGYYVASIEEIYTEMRQYKHDFQNILLPIGYFMENNQFKEAMAFFRENVTSVQVANNEKIHVVSHLKNMEIPELKGLILSKYQWAIHQQVDFSIWVEHPVKQLDVDIVDLCRMIGVLLDNAIEAASEVEKGYVNIQVVLEESTLRMEIINNFNVNNIDSSFMKISTKGEERGIGLNSLHYIVERYAHVSLETHVTGGKCTQILLFNKVAL